MGAVQEAGGQAGPRQLAGCAALGSPPVLPLLQRSPELLPCAESDLSFVVSPCITCVSTIPLSLDGRLTTHRIQSVCVSVIQAPIQPRCHAPAHLCMHISPAQPCAPSEPSSGRTLTAAADQPCAGGIDAAPVKGPCSQPQASVAPEQHRLHGTVDPGAMTRTSLAVRRPVQGTSFSTHTALDPQTTPQESQEPWHRK